MKAYYLARRNFLEILRDPLTLTLGMALPIALLALFTAIGSRAPIDVFKPGNMVPAIAVFGHSFLTMFTAMLIAHDRQSALFSRIMTAPLGRSGIFLAYLIPQLPVAAIQTGSCLAAGTLLGFVSGPGLAGACLAFLVSSLFCIASGIILGIAFSQNQIAGIGSLFINVAGILGGAWMDLDMVGGPIQAVASALPFANAVKVSRSLANGSVPDLASAEFLVLTLWTSGALAVGILLFGRKTKG